MRRLSRKMCQMSGYWVKSSRSNEPSTFACADESDSPNKKKLNNYVRMYGKTLKLNRFNLFPFTTSLLLLFITDINTMCGKYYEGRKQPHEGCLDKKLTSSGGIHALGIQDEILLWRHFDYGRSMFALKFGDCFLISRGWITSSGD